MSLMSGLFLGATGLQTSQNSLHTTAHNLSNIETPGYVRQQTLHADMSYNTISTSPAVSLFRGATGKQMNLMDAFAIFFVVVSEVNLDAMFVFAIEVVQ